MGRIINMKSIRIKYKKIAFKLIIFIIIFFNFYSALYVIKPNTLSEKQSVNGKDSNKENLRTSASESEYEYESQYVRAGEPKDYSMNLDDDKYLIWVEAKSNIDYILDVATNAEFNQTIDHMDENGNEQDERCIIDLDTAQVIYVRVSCAIESGHFNLIVTDNIHKGYTELTLNTEIGGNLREEDYNIYYIEVQPGTINIRVTTSWDMDLELKIYDDPLLEDKIAKSDNPGMQADESVDVVIEKEDIIYIKVTCLGGSGFYDIVVTQLFNPEYFLIGLIVIIVVAAIIAFAVISAKLPAYRRKRKSGTYKLTPGKTGGSPVKISSSKSSVTQSKSIVSDTNILKKLENKFSKDSKPVSISPEKTKKLGIQKNKLNIKSPKIKKEVISKEEDPLKILYDKFESGEITVQEYLRKKKLIED